VSETSDGSVEPTRDLPGADPVQSAFHTAVDLLESERCSLLLREHGEPHLIVACHVGMPEPLVPTIRVQKGEGIAGTVYQTGHSLLGRIAGRTFVSVPISTSRGVEGVLNATNRRGGREYSTFELEIAVKAAAHIGTLLDYERTAARDPISGLPNRQTFEEALEREVARAERNRTAMALMFLDLDNLKAMNDRYGHERGDAAIRAIGTIVQRALRPYDFACRFGGDEFVLLLTGTAEAETKAAVTAIGARLSEGAVQESREFPFPLAISVGASFWPADGKTGRDLLAVADARMYEHKRGKKTYSQS
jgi:diguanylate cyclase (GGDEF)-like protein